MTLVIKKKKRVEQVLIFGLNILKKKAKDKIAISDLGKICGANPEFGGHLRGWDSLSP